MQKETFTFNSSKEFEKCKKLYNGNKPSYIVLEYGNNTVQVRDLTAKSTELYFAKSDSDFQKFINDNTMGIGVDVPVLSGNCVLEEEAMSVTYEPVFGTNDLIDVEREVYTKYLNWFLGFEVVLLIGITVLANQRENKQLFLSGRQMKEN